MPQAFCTNAYVVYAIVGALVLLRHLSLHLTPTALIWLVDVPSLQRAVTLPMATGTAHVAHVAWRWRSSLWAIVDEMARCIAQPANISGWWRLLIGGIPIPATMPTLPLCIGRCDNCLCGCLHRRGA